MPVASASLSETSGQFFWTVGRCPHCGKRHTHGGGSTKENPHDMLGHRSAHCVSDYGKPHRIYRPMAENSFGYELVCDGQCGRPDHREMEVRTPTEGKYLRALLRDDHQERSTPLATTVRLYKNGEQTCIWTNAATEDEFQRHFVQALAQVIKSGNVDDWRGHLAHWLPQMVDICCKLRGYRAETVAEERVLIAGAIFDSTRDLVVASDDQPPPRKLSAVEAELHPSPSATVTDEAP